MLNKNLFTLLSYLLLTGCGMIDYHPYDVRISGETDVNAHNIEQIEADCKGKKTIRFVTMGDSQRWYDETEDFVKAINKRNDIDFVIHGGDMSDFGVTKEFLWQRDIMNGLSVPYVTLIGNHDCLGTHCLLRDGTEITSRQISHEDFRIVRNLAEKYGFPLALEVDKGIFVNYVNDTVIALSELTNHPIPLVVDIDKEFNACKCR